MAFGIWLFSILVLAKLGMSPLGDFALLWYSPFQSSAIPNDFWKVCQVTCRMTGISLSTAWLPNRLENMRSLMKKILISAAFFSQILSSLTNSHTHKSAGQFTIWYRIKTLRKLFRSQNFRWLFCYPRKSIIYTFSDIIGMIYHSNFHSLTTLAISLEAETHHLIFPYYKCEWGPLISWHFDRYLISVWCNRIAELCSSHIKKQHSMTNRLNLVPWSLEFNRYEPNTTWYNCRYEKQQHWRHLQWRVWKRVITVCCLDVGLNWSALQTSD